MGDENHEPCSEETPSRGETMTMTSKPISHFLAPALLVLSTVLAAANWYLRPAAGRSLGSDPGLSRLYGDGPFFAHRRSRERVARAAGDAIRNAVVFAGLMLAIPLGCDSALPWASSVTPNSRGARRWSSWAPSLAFTGNAMPKTLTPLSALQCDPAQGAGLSTIRGLDVGADRRAGTRSSGWCCRLTWRSRCPSRCYTGMLLVAVQLLRLRRTRATRSRGRDRSCLRD